MVRTNPNFLNGVPEMLILHLLSRREMYGYELVKALQQESRETFNFGEGCVYPILHYLEKTKLLKSERKEVGGRSRNYYHLTSKGEERLAALRSEWEGVRVGVGTVLGERYA